MNQTGLPARIHSLQAVLEKDPKCFDAVFELSVLLRMDGKVASAAKYGQRAVDIKPGNADAHGNLASCFSLLLRSADAAASLRRAIDLDPKRSTFRHNLGIELERLGRDAEAMDSYRAAIVLDSTVPNSYVSLGRLLRASGLPEEADVVIEKVFSVVADRPHGYLELARSMLDEGLVEDARVCLQKAIDLEPSSWDAHSMMGTAFMQLGQFSDAEQSLHRAIGLEPSRIKPYIDILRSKKATLEDLPMIEKIASEEKSLHLSCNEKRDLQYALGKAFDDIGKYGRAMGHFDKANQLMRTQLGGARFDRARHTAMFDQMIRGFSEKLLAQRKGLGVPSDKPIFIVGMIRSGTTLVEQIVSSHPDVAAGGELTFLLDRYQRIMTPAQGSSPHQEVAKLATEYLELLKSIGGDKRHVTDKMPNNILLLGLIHTIFPNARIIHCRRNPVDNCISIYTTPFPQPLSYAHDKNEIVFYYREYLRLMAHWRSVLPSDRFLEIEYESLVADRESVSRRMIEFCGLPWDDACLHHDRNGGAIRTPSWWQARQPVYTSSVSRWRNYEPWLGAFRDLL